MQEDNSTFSTPLESDPDIPINSINLSASTPPTKVVKEKTISTLMTKNTTGTPGKSDGKRQTSLLSFFTPSPKRPDSRQESPMLATASSPSKRQTIPHTTNLSQMTSDVPSSFYEMISDEEEVEVEVEGKTSERPKAGVEMEEDTLRVSKKPISRSKMSIDDNDDVSRLDISSFGFDESSSTNEVTLISMKSSKLLNVLNVDGEEDASMSIATAATSAERYPWLVKVRDINGNAPGDADYDPRTLYIPKAAWNAFTPFEKQFWEIKCKLFDTVVFFKKGKFYELYEGDADIGSREFDLKMTDRVNMRMVGVPEASFEMWASRFVAAGHKIARVDQTETAIGKSLRERESNAKRTEIIKRELSCILTAGTVTEPTMLSSDASNYCLALKVIIQGAACKVGVCTVDASTGAFQVGSFVDDLERLSLLETMLMQLQPREILLEKGHFPSDLLRLIKSLLPSALITEALAEKEFWPSRRIADEVDMNRYFAAIDDVNNEARANSQWPRVLIEAYESDSLGFSAFGAMLWYLKELKLDKGLLSFRNFAAFDPLKSDPINPLMILDGQTLLNLDVLPKAGGSMKGTLLGVIEHCKTPFGRRLLQRWLCHPLCNTRQINARLDVIDFMMANPRLSDSLVEAFTGLPDLERSIARIHSGSVKVKDFLSCLDGLARCVRLIVTLQQSQVTLPALLQHIITPIKGDECSSLIEYLSNAFDRELALKEGIIIPHKGFEETFDEAEDKLAAIKASLQAYLLEQEKALKSRGFKYKDVGKEIFQLEVPHDLTVPSSEYILMSKTKTTKRYWTPAIKKWVKEFQEWEERRAGALRSIFSTLTARFDSHVALWRIIIDAISQLDCLHSLMKASSTMAEPKCRPHLEDVSEAGAICDMRDLRHPGLTDAQVSSFISNDVILDETDRIIVLTGPNMGGKSTLLRQTCLAVILAQLGCYVPASSCRLSPVDRIFTRLGANDNIVGGQSTFMVELLDTAKVLKEATKHSLVILDELGRGTSTFDGMAIAQAVLLYLCRQIKCIGLFATHYRPLAVDCSMESGAKCMFMDCAMDADSRRVTFLYRLTKGISPKSYGMNVATMAGIPSSVIDEAEIIAEQMESQLSLSTTSDPSSISTKKQLYRLLLDHLCPLH